MVKRFWPLLILILVVTMAAILIPAATTLMPKFTDLQYDVKVYPTHIDLNTSLINFTKDVNPGEPFEVSGYLYYIDTEYLRQNADLIRQGLMDISEAYLPLPYRKVTVGLYGANSAQVLVIEIVTDSEGYFQTTLVNNDKSVQQPVIGAFYGGEEQIQTYSGTSKRPLKTIYWVTARIIPEGEKIKIPGQEGLIDLSAVTPITVIVFGVIFVGVVAYFIFHYRKLIYAWLKRRKAKTTAPETENTYTLLTSTQAISEVSTGDPRVEILFPQIENPLPPIWGVGEPLTISCHALVKKSDSNLQFPPQIEIKDKALDITVNGFTPVQIEHTFATKSEVDINVFFGADTDEKMSGTRKIRLVDYREEIVALFNQLIDSLATKGINVDRMMTAREIEMRLKGKYPDISSETIQDIVNGFEYANYSLHPVARQIYLDVYLAVEKIRERMKNE